MSKNSLKESFLLATVAVFIVSCSSSEPLSTPFLPLAPTATIFPSLTPTITTSNTPLPTPTFTPEPTKFTGPCPTNPEDWSLVETTPGDSMKHIEPTCVYEGLERTMAFVLGIKEGYSRKAVADVLGFEELPMQPPFQVTVPFPNGPELMTVTIEIAVPIFKEWMFQDDGKSAISLALQGCFNTYTVVDNEKKYWDDNGYEVLCRVSYDDEASGGAICLGDLCYAETGYPSSRRSFLLFGYAGDGQWNWLGEEGVTEVELDSQTMSKDRANSAQKQGVGPWDGIWLEQVYGLTMQPLPENWQAVMSEADLRKVLDAVDAYNSGGTSP
jgi:hypothetical protein